MAVTAKPFYLRHFYQAESRDKRTGTLGTFLIDFIQGGSKRMAPYSIRIRAFYEFFQHFLIVETTQINFL